MNTKPKQFGSLLKSSIRKHGISTAEFAKKIKTSRTNIHNLESGRRAAGSEIVASILNELDFSEIERNEFLQAALEQSDSLKAGIEVGNWKFATQWWKIFGLKAVKTMGLDPEAPNIQFRWWPIVHEKWLIRCHYQNPDIMVVLGYDDKKDRIEAAHKDFDLRMTTPLPTRATRWWANSLNLGTMSSDGSPILAANSQNVAKLRNHNKSQH
ncbi:MAG: helix-turn-helix domain-containing protein [Luteolibacter sp.]